MADSPGPTLEFTVSLQTPKYFWLGLRGALGTLIWLAPSFVIIAAFRDGETGFAGLVGFAALLLLGLGMLYLPMLQVHFAAENRFRALFEVRTIRRDFRRAPWSWFAAMVICLVLTPIPLYLLKIEANTKRGDVGTLPVVRGFHHARPAWRPAWPCEGQEEGRI